MVVTFLLGLAAGAGAGWAEAHVQRALAAAFGIEQGEISARDMRVISLVVVLFLAAILSALLGNGSAMGLMFGALLGVLVPRLSALLRAARTPDYDS